MRITSVIAIFLATVGVAAAQPDSHDYSWSGFYAGVSLGAIINQSRLNANHTNFLDRTYNSSLDSTDVLPGLHAGYNYELPTGLVLGAEADFTYPDSTSTFNNTLQTAFGNKLFDKFTFKNRLQGAIRGRVGFALSHFLPYVTAGVSFADTSLRYENEASEFTKKDSVQAGWILGAGLEYGLCRNLSVRTEYLYTDYNNSISMAIPTVIGAIDPNGFAKADLISHSVRAALNFRF